MNFHLDKIDEYYIYSAGKLIEIDLGDVTCQVEIGSNTIINLFSTLQKNKNDILIIIDKNIAEIYCKKLKYFYDFNLVILNGGKENKSFLTLKKIFSKLDKLNFPRSGKIVAIGGGVIGDIAGLAASLWYRGCQLVHVPTTLLSSVDSCIGGKTALNFKSTINAIGSYYHPSRVVIDTKLLSKLPKRELKSGFAEIIKYSILGDKLITNKLYEIKKSDLINIDDLEDIIKLCLLRKAKFVKWDIQEKNKRLLLNLGHTIGHALEINSIVNGKEQLRHGEGVALGIVAISKIATEVGKLSKTDFQKIINLIKKFDLPINISAMLFKCERKVLIKKCVDSVFRDKKRTSKFLRLILPMSSSGSCEIYQTDSTELIRSAIEYVIKY